MKILRTRAASVSRQGLCTALLVASLTTAAVGASPPQGGGNADPSPGPDNPQRQPHGVPNLSLPDLVPRPGATNKPGQTTGQPGTDGNTGIPRTALAAYKNAESLAKDLYPNCHIQWQLIAGIGKVESEHAAGYGLRPDGTTEKPIRGPQLTGSGFALVKDTDGGAYDGDAVYDRAVGPTQFIPSTWKDYGADGNGDGKRDPNNIFDAAAGTARYLCSGNKDLSSAADLDRAILSYNNSREYVNAVLAWMRTYQKSEVGALPDTAPWTPRPSGTPSGTPSGGKPVPGPFRPTPSGSGSGSSKPGTSPTPSKPAPKPTPSKPGGGDKPTPPKPTPTPTPTPSPATVSRLDRVGAQEFTATAGEAFAEGPKVKAVTADGRPVPAGTQVRFEVVGLYTEARFPGKSREAVVRVAADGTAAAPELLAGDKAGPFTVRVTVEGSPKVTAVDFTATVKPLRADTLQRVDGSGVLKAAPKGSFAERLKIKAVGKDRPVADTVVTATLLTADGKPAEAGPYFKDENGKPVRRLALPKTGEDGLVTLPELFTDEQPGTYVLRLTTTEGPVLNLELTVTAPAATPTPSATPSATPSPAAK